MYKVVKSFFDLEDNSRWCEAGEEYPRKGYEPSKERIKELSTEANRLGEPLIQEITEPKPKAKTNKKK